MRIVSGHQPVYLPWLGLFHKASLADVFVFMDDVQYLRQDWNNRNKIKGSQGAFWLTVPVRLKQSASEMLRDIRVDSDGFGAKRHWQSEHFRALETCYRKAPYWDQYAPFLESFYHDKPWDWLWEINLTQLQFFFEELAITPELLIATEVGFKGAKSDLVLDHCRKTGAGLCVTGTFGRDYIDVQSFIDEGLSLHFQEYQHPDYSQRYGDFVSHLSVIDLLMNHGPDSRDLLLSGNVTRSELEQAVKQKGEPGVIERSSGK